MSRYDLLEPVEVLRTMGGAQRDLLLALTVRWDTAHPSTRDALITRGLARHTLRSGQEYLTITETGEAVRDLVYGGHR